MNPIIHIIENENEMFTLTIYENEIDASNANYSFFQKHKDRESAEAQVKRLGYPVAKWQLTRTADGREWHGIYA